MKTVIFAGTSAQEHPECGVLLMPGVNIFPDAVADYLVRFGVVSAEAPAPAPLSAPAVVSITPAPDAPIDSTVEAPGSAKTDKSAAIGGSRKEAKV